MSEPAPSHTELFLRTLADCRELYHNAALRCTRESSDSLGGKPGEFVAAMEDLHRTLVLKVYITVCECDRVWSGPERTLATHLAEHIWGEPLTGTALRNAIRDAAVEIAAIDWYSLVRPFDRIALLRDDVGQLETIVLRLANIVARVDGHLEPQEALVIQNIERELHVHLRPLSVDGGQHAPQGAQQVMATVPAQAVLARTSMAPKVESPESRPDLAAVLAELDALTGLDSVKREVRTLANFLNLQRRRTAAGLTTTDIGLHLVFSGNPGTGKTTVARLVGRIYCALGVLSRGHLIETDRGGLVAEYAGQTAPKTSQKIDEALDGILFIDEAYSLLGAGAGEDPYGREAVQTLLKRAEDERHRLVIILAGYTSEMEELIESNPGLSSRFARTLHFDDYNPVELCRIFASFAQRNQYRIDPRVRLQLLRGFTHLHRDRDRHFGNGRTVRNLFEHAIRRMANRLAHQSDASAEDLQTLLADDIEFVDLATETYVAGDLESQRIRFACPQCGHAKAGPATYLGRGLICPRCETKFTGDWGELLEPFGD